MGVGALESLGERRLPVSLTGDGAGSLVEALAAREDGGEVTVLVWNTTLDQTKAAGEPALARRVTVAVDGLEPGRSYTVSHDRVDQDHSNIARVWGDLRAEDQAWPTEKEGRSGEADRLAHLEPPRDVTAEGQGEVTVTFGLPMPAMSLLTLAPVASDG